MFVSPAKIAETIKMPFGGLSGVGPRNHAIRWGPDPPQEWAFLRKCMSHEEPF